MLEPWYRNVVVAALVGLVLIALFDFAATRNWRRLGVTLLALVAAVVALRALVGFPGARISFAGGVPVTVAIGVLFLSTAIGIAANYVFYLRGTFSWLSALKPLCVTPIVVLPMLGSLQGLTFLQPVQLVSFAFLSFQNGFFWRTVLERAKTKASA